MVMTYAHEHTVVVRGHGSWWWVMVMGHGYYWCARFTRHRVHVLKLRGFPRKRSINKNLKSTTTIAALLLGAVAVPDGRSHIEQPTW